MPDNHDMDDIKSKPTISVVGDPGGWVLLGKAHTNEDGKGYGWMKSTKVMPVPGGVLVQVTTEHRFDGRVTACAEAGTCVARWWPDGSPVLSAIPGLVTG